MSSEFGFGKEFFKKKILKGEALKIGDRIIYPMIQVSTFRGLMINFGSNPLHPLL